MNKVELVGNLTDDVKFERTNGGEDCKMARFTVAVDRRYKDESGRYRADFVSCRAYGRVAEFLERNAEHFSKGAYVSVVGMIRAGGFPSGGEEDDKRVCVVAEECRFVGVRHESKEEGQKDGEIHE